MVRSTYCYFRRQLNNQESDLLAFGEKSSKSQHDASSNLLLVYRPSSAQIIRDQIFPFCQIGDKNDFFLPHMVCVYFLIELLYYLYIYIVRYFHLKDLY